MIENNSGQAFLDSEDYTELLKIAEKLTAWFRIDPAYVLWNCVWVFPKTEPNSSEGPQYNLFDIYEDGPFIYQHHFEIPSEAMPVIEEIQDKLAEISQHISEGWY